MNEYYPVIARAIGRLERSTWEARWAVYERARKAVAQLRSNQTALLDADIADEYLALEEAIRKVEAEAARNSSREARAEPRSAALSEGLPEQPASPRREDRPPALSSRQGPIFLASASADRDNPDIQAVAIGGAYGADYYHDDIPGSRWWGGLLVMMAVLALAVLAGAFAYRGMFGGYTFPALSPIVTAGTGPNNIVRNNSDTRRNNSSQTSATSASSSEKLQPINIREAPKAVPRVVSNIPISSKPSAGAVAPAPAAPAPAFDPVVASALDQHIASSVLPLASAPAVALASAEPKETAAVTPIAREPDAPMPALAPSVLAEASVPPPASAPAPALASAEPEETAAVTPLAREPDAPMPALAPPVLTEASVPPPASAPAPALASAEPEETAAVTPVAREPDAPMPALAAPVLTEASVPPPASAPAPAPVSAEPEETAAVTPVAREPDAPMPALAPPVLTEASVPPPASAPAPALSAEPKEIHRVKMKTDTAATQSAAALPVGNHAAREEAAPSPSSGSPMQAGSGTAAEVSSGGAYAVQLASERSASEAHASFRALRAKFPNQLGGREPIVRRTDLGAKGIYYRAMVGPFASMEKAAGMCRTLKVAGCNCLVQRN